MSQLVKKLANVCYNLNDLYYKTEDKEDKKSIKTYFDSLSNKLEYAIRCQFDKNDIYYKRTVKKLREAEKEIDKLKINLQKIEKLFGYLTNIALNIDILIHDFKRDK